MIYPEFFWADQLHLGVPPPPFCHHGWWKILNLVPPDAPKMHSLAMPVLRFLCKTFSKLRKCLKKIFKLKVKKPFLGAQTGILGSQTAWICHWHIFQVNYKNTRFMLFLSLFCQLSIIYHFILIFFLFSAEFGQILACWILIDFLFFYILKFDNGFQ